MKKFPPALKALREASLSEPAAVEFLETRRWGSSPACPRCGSVDVYQMRSRDGARNKDFRWRCRDCKRMYTVRTGTVFEESRLPLRVWVHTLWRACASKKGVSALQIARETGVTHKSALYMLHRIRRGMDEKPRRKLTGTIEADETYVGGKPRNRRPGRQGKHDKTPVVGILERGGEVRFHVMERVTVNKLREAIREQVDMEGSRLMTDESPAYTKLGREFGGGHGTTAHAKGEYARGEIHSNTIESAFSLIKRGVYGTFHSVSKKHLHRYMSEFEFRYNTRSLTDGERIAAAIKATEGKRLTYAEQINPLAVPAP